MCIQTIKNILNCGYINSARPFGCISFISRQYIGLISHRICGDPIRHIHPQKWNILQFDLAILNYVYGVVRIIEIFVSQTFYRSYCLRGQVYFCNCVILL
ncbi:hypothetical protein D3C73_937370 [compost metagenome]